MRVCALVHMYPALGHHAGAEWMLHTFMRHHASSGDQADVYVDSTLPREAIGTTEGVTVYTGFPEPELLSRYDAAYTHLDETLNAARLCKQSGDVPLVHLVHNQHQLGYHGVNQETCALAIFNSQWLADRVRYPGRQLVCHPPIIERDYTVAGSVRGAGGAGYITLVNLSYEKGADLFYALADRLPDHSFKGVIGSYGNQQIRFNVPNVRIHQPTPNIARDVYAHTRILVMPSTQESYGRCAVEAMVSGVPVLATDTRGLVEATQGAAQLLPAGDLAAWEAAIRALDEPAAWEQASALSTARAAKVSVESRVDLRRVRRAVGRLTRTRPAGRPTERAVIVSAPHARRI